MGQSCSFLLLGGRRGGEQGYHFYFDVLDKVRKCEYCQCVPLGLKFQFHKFLLHLVTRSSYQQCELSQCCYPLWLWATLSVQVMVSSLFLSLVFWLSSFLRCYKFQFHNYLNNYQVECLLWFKIFHCFFSLKSQLLVTLNQQAIFSLGEEFGCVCIYKDCTFTTWNYR